MAKKNDYIEKIEKRLDELIPIKYPQKIYDSMRYSVLAGGKRLRPMMCLEACKMFNGNVENALDVACAIEMLHTQSLIHDDLPCMDNDDYRRGKLTNHKKFDEATAVLAGDALLSFAPNIILHARNLSENTKLSVLDEFFKAAGVDGIISGQIVDLDSENKKINRETLDYLHTYKTAALFKFALKAGAIIAGAEKSDLNKMEELGQNFGMAFQICDDILDEISTFEEMGKTLGKDKNANKQTYVTIYGLEYSKNEVSCLLNKCCDIIGEKSEILNSIINEIRDKINC
ncbi:polyprenyl synthetase family protein [bacterium]|nr:polyprenyl synthetase family protein [bacterium]